MATNPTSTEALRDLVLSHRLGLNRLANGEARELLKLVTRLEKEIRRRLRQRLALAELTGGDSGPVTTLRLDALLEDLQALHRATFRDLNSKLRDSMVELAAVEAELARAQLTRVIPPEILAAYPVAGVTAQKLRAIVTSKPFRGRLLRNHFRRIEANSWKGVTEAFETIISAAITEGTGPAKAVRDLERLILSKRKASRGVLAKITRPQLSTLTRTAIGHVSQASRLATYRRNSGKDGVIKGYLWLSVLDLRTTLGYCWPRDHKVYSLNYEPIGHSLSWSGGPGRIHFNCRATFVPVLKSWRELGLKRAELPRTARASMNGSVPARVTAPVWVKKQLSNPESRRTLQRVWGRRRVELFESGKLSIDDMVKDDGGVWSMKHLVRTFGVAA